MAISKYHIGIHKLQVPRKLNAVYQMGWACIHIVKLIDKRNAPKGNNEYAQGAVDREKPVNRIFAENTCECSAYDAGRVLQGRLDKVNGVVERNF